MNYEQINEYLSTAIDFISLAEEEMKKNIDWSDDESVDLSYGIMKAGGELLKIRHEIFKKYKKDHL